MDCQIAETAARPSETPVSLYKDSANGERWPQGRMGEVKFCHHHRRRFRQPQEEIPVLLGSSASALLHLPESLCIYQCFLANASAFLSRSRETNQVGSGIIADADFIGHVGGIPALLCKAPVV